MIHIIIRPQSIINLLHNVRLDSSYDNTIYFDSSSAQQSYFSSQVKYALTDYTYVKNNAITVGISTDNLVDCNYLSFQNVGFTSKWYYAFITNVEYLNNTTSLITYEIDVLQSWYFDIDYKPSFIERMHIPIAEDKVNQNLVDEDLNIGDYMCHTKPIRVELGESCIVVASASDGVSPSIGGGSFCGIYSGCAFFAYDNTTAGRVQLQTFLTTLTEKAKIDSIVSIFMCPRKFVPLNVTTGSKLYSEIITGSIPQTIGEYTPKNKKLLHSPYSILKVNNGCGSEGNYLYEYFSQISFNQYSFRLNGALNCDVSCSFSPINYKNSDPTALLLYNNSESMSLKGFPLCSFNVDSYKAWLAQNFGSISISMASSVAGLAIGVATGSPLGVVAGALSVGNTIGSFVDKSKEPPINRGSNGSSVYYSTGDMTFTLYQTQVTEERARIIDNYFELYGYKVNSVEVPTFNSRPHWNYIKTQNANIYCSSATQVVEKLKSIFDRGITFWKNGSEVGNYNLNNH